MCELPLGIQDEISGNGLAGNRCTALPPRIYLYADSRYHSPSVLPRQTIILDFQVESGEEYFIKVTDVRGL